MLYLLAHYIISQQLPYAHFSGDMFLLIDFSTWESGNPKDITCLMGHGLIFIFLPLNMINLAKTISHPGSGTCVRLVLFFIHCQVLF